MYNQKQQQLMDDFLQCDDLKTQVALAVEAFDQNIGIDFWKKLILLHHSKEECHTYIYDEFPTALTKELGIETFFPLVMKEEFLLSRLYGFNRSKSIENAGSFLVLFFAYAVMEEFDFPGYRCYNPCDEDEYLQFDNRAFGQMNHYLLDNSSWYTLSGMDIWTKVLQQIMAHDFRAKGEVDPDVFLSFLINVVPIPQKEQTCFITPKSTALNEAFRETCTKAYLHFGGQKREEYALWL